MSAPSYAIRRSEKARRARIQVTAAGVEVVVPKRLTLDEIEPFIAEKRPWIERTYRKMMEAEAQRPPPRLVDGGSVPYLGEQLELQVRVEPDRSRPRVVRDGTKLSVAVADGGEDSVRAALEGWYRSRAREEIEARLDAATARAGTTYSGLSIRAQRTRWASCSAKGAMSFNWRLLLAPVEVLDYVVEHEVAHLDVHDHSRRFWRLVGRRMPGYEEHERWLSRNGQTLTL